MAARLGVSSADVVSAPWRRLKPKLLELIDPFTKQERVFAAKPASVKLKTRALKKLKDAAL